MWKRFHDEDSKGVTVEETFTPPAGSVLWRKDFLVGAATAVYQIEGAIHEDGRIASIRDVFSATPGGESACDHYRRWRKDLELLAGLNVDAYRLLIAWPRVMTADGQPNEKGIAFYRQLRPTMRRRRSAWSPTSAAAPASTAARPASAPPGCSNCSTITGYSIRC